MVAMPPGRVLFHPDPLRLEAALVEHLRSFRAGNPWAPILVVVPTRRLVARLRERLAASFGALLGVEILEYQGLALRILESGDDPLPRLLSRAALEEVLRRELEQHPGFSLAEYARERPGVISDLVARIEELREAGIDPETVRRAGSRPEDRELADLFASMEIALNRLEAGGWTDRAGIARRATAAIRRRREVLASGPGAGPSYEAIFAYGAYELVGMHLDLLEVLAPPGGVTSLVLADASAPAWAYAAEAAGRHRGAPSPIPDPPEGSTPFVAAARALYDETAQAPVLDGNHLEFLHAQGAEAELGAVTKRVLSLLAEGVPASHIAILARSLEPYLATAETVFARHRLPVDISGALPLARHPQARTLLLLLRGLRDDFDRRTVLELVRAPFLLLPQEFVESGSLWRPASWDRWSRTFGVTEGVEAWTVDLPRFLREQSPPRWIRADPVELAGFRTRQHREADSAELLGRLILAWDGWRRRWAACRGSGEHAGFLRELARTWIRDWEPSRPETSGGTALRAAWEDALGQLGALDAGGIPVTAGSALDFVVRALEEATVPSRRPGAVSFLDAMQARGLHFPHVFLIGFNDRLFPRAARETPLLPDPLREGLRQAAGRPLAVRSESRMEERLLLAQLIASTGDRLVVSWQRADADGKALSVSLALRELARCVPGSPSMREIVEDKARIRPARVPTEPGLAARWLAETTGMLTREEAALLATRTGPGGPAAMRSFASGLDPGLAARLEPGLAMIESIDTRGGTSLAFDGGIDGDSIRDRFHSPSGLERLGRCPLTFFFERVLRIRPLEEELEEGTFETRETGLLVHAALEAVFAELHRAGDLDGRLDTEALARAGRRALDTVWKEAFAPLAHRLEARYPVLFRDASARWRAEMEAFLDKDLRRLAAEGHRLEFLEDAWTAEIPLGAPDPAGDAGVLRVRGIPDRVTRDGTGARLLVDYKTSGNLEAHLDPKSILRGERLQIPLYLLLGLAREPESPIRAELLGIGPAFLPDDGFARTEPPSLTGEDVAGMRAGLVDTLRVLAALPGAGRFPFRVGHHCSWCRFQAACRRRHHESRIRVEHHPDHREFALIGKKTRKKTLVAELHAGDEDAP